jgi:phosphatidylserine decarboxylase
MTATPNEVRSFVNLFYNMRIHREGPPIILIATLLLGAAVASVFWGLRGTNWVWLAWVLLVGAVVLLGLVVNFFRSPVFQVPTNPLHVLAPANGKLVVNEVIEETVYFNRPVRQLSIFMSPLDVHVNRTPMAGKVQWLRYFPGKYLVAWHPKSSTENEQTFLVLRTEYGDVGVKQIAGAVARRIKWYVQQGQALQQGQEFGFIRFGSRVDVLLPLEAEVTVPLGAVVKGGRTVLAKFPPNTPKHVTFGPES